MPRIMICDDDPDVVEAVAMCLRNEGHEVLSAHGREEGMQVVDSESPDLLVLDCMMAEADDGLVMARELRRGGFEKPILMLTNINKISGLQLNKDSEMVPVDAFYEKPIQPRVLIEKVNELLASKSSQ
jgi:CheY-like chemotaxis protein